MSAVDDKQSTDFGACFETYRKATGELMHAVYEHSPDEAEAVYNSLTLTHKITKAINDRIAAEKRNERMNKIRELMPNEGDECTVDICHESGCGETWMVRGRLLVAWHDDEPVDWSVWAVVEVIRPLTDEENDNDYQTDDSWNGCKFVCRYNTYLDDWRARWPANDIARELWGDED